MDTTRSRRQALLTLVSTVAFEALAVVVLVALGRTPSARIDTADLGRWLDTTPLVDVAFALLRVVALVLVAYLLATTVVYVLARLTRIPALVSAVAPLTLPTVRRIADRAIAGTMVTATLVGGVPVAASAVEPTPPSVVSVTESGALLPPGVRAPAQADDATVARPTGPAVARSTPIPTPRPGAPSTPGPAADATAPEARPSVPIPTPRPMDASPTASVDAVEDDGTASLERDGTVRLPGIPVPRRAPAAPPAEAVSDGTEETAPQTAPETRPSRPAAPAAPATPAAPSAELPQGPARSSTTGEWVAARGDSLWHIAEHVVADGLGVSVDQVADAQVADYWHALVAANRETVASGDVDVVAIGERIELPPFEAS